MLNNHPAKTSNIMDKVVHYLGIQITITREGYLVENHRYPTIGAAKIAIAAVNNLKHKKLAS